MSSPAGPPWTGQSAPGGAAYSDMRVSDAERAEVADRLSRHYGAGRLDQAEFEERLDRAMKAKTRADFNGLFADLPESEPPGPQAAAGTVPPGAGPPGPSRPGLAGPPPGTAARPWHRRHRVLFLVLVVLLAVTAGPALAHMFVPWLLIGLLVLVVLRIIPGRCRRF